MVCSDALVNTEGEDGNQVPWCDQGVSMEVRGRVQAKGKSRLCAVGGVQAGIMVKALNCTPRMQDTGIYSKTIGHSQAIIRGGENQVS